MRRSVRFLVVVFLLFVVTVPVQGSDGIIEINQASAIAGGVTTGDTPGFPVTLSAPGSYLLTGNLTVPGENTRAIDVASNDVTLDMNGFVIQGPVVCSGTPLECVPSGGSGEGIFASTRTGVTVRNGTIRGLGNDGVELLGGSTRIEGLSVLSNGGVGVQIDAGAVSGSHAESNGGGGLAASGAATISANTVVRNGDIGIFAGNGSNVHGNSVRQNESTGIHLGFTGTVSGNTVTQNGDDGIFLTASGTVTNNTVESNGDDNIEDHGIHIQGTAFVSGNTVTMSSGHGLRLAAFGAYSGNSLNANNGGCQNAQLLGGVEIGTNHCCGTTCP